MRLAAGFIVLAAIGATLPALLAGYSIWDDEVFVGESPFGTMNPIAAVWTVLRGEAYGRWAYYPVFHLSMAFDVLLFRERALLSHLFNIAIHAVNALIVWGAIRLAMRDAFSWPVRVRVQAATVGAVLFAVHPLNVEPVAWVSGRKVLLGFLFAMLAFVCAARGVTGKRAWIVGVACYALALLSNALFLALPVLIGAYVVWNARDRWLSALARTTPFVVVAAAAIAVRLLGHSTEAESARQIRTWSALSGETAAFLDSQARLLAHVLLPFRLSPVYRPSASSFHAAGAWIGIALVVVWVLAVLCGSRRVRSPLVRLLAWGAFWYGVALLPTFAHHLHLADRYFYFSGVGVCMGASALAGVFLHSERRARAGRRAARALVGLVLAVLLVLSFRQGFRWRSDLDLFGYAARRAPWNAMARNNYGFALLQAGRRDEAILELDAALRIDPRHLNALLNMGSVLSGKGDDDRALGFYLRAVETAPYALRARIGLASCWVALGHPERALPHFEEAVRLSPRGFEAHYGLASVLARMGRDARARRHFEETVALNPDWPYGLAGLARLLNRAGETERARRLYDRALERSIASGDKTLEEFIRGAMRTIHAESGDGPSASPD